MPTRRHEWRELQPSLGWRSLQPRIYYIQGTPPCLESSRFAAALLSFLATPAQAEPIILCGGDTVFVVDTAAAKDNIERRGVGTPNSASNCPKPCEAHLPLRMTASRWMVARKS